MAQVYILEAANLFCGSDDPSSSKHLTLRDLKLPLLEEKTVEFHPAGSMFAVSIGALGFNALTCSFRLIGFDPDMLRLFGLSSVLTRRYTAYGVVRDKISGAPKQVKAIMDGRLQRHEPDAFNRGELKGDAYVISEMMHYELWFDRTEEFFFDFPTVSWRVGGVDQNDERQLLGLV
jgi:phage tail tube protein FII